MNEVKILVVDDEPDILEFISYNLQKEGFIVSTANNGEEALVKAAAEDPHLIILDFMMPGIDGIEVCSQLRNQEQFKDTIIAFLTARNDDYIEIAGLDVGGDDYITKPIRSRVLISRIKALLRRSNRLNDNAEDILKVGNLVINRERFSVEQDGVGISFAKKEFELIYLLASKPGKVFTRKEIFSEVWGNDVIVGDRTIDVHIRKLREKIGNQMIKTIKGIGYKFEF